MTSRVASVTQIDLTDRADPYGLVAAPDGALWVTLVHSGAVVRIGVDGRRDHFPVGSGTCRPSVPAVSPDGRVWFTCTGDDRLCALDERGDMRSVDLESGCGPYGLCAGGDGTLWFTESTAHRLGRRDADGTIRHTGLPAGCFPAMVAARADGTVWAALNQAHAVARVSAAGELTIVDLPTDDAAPVGIACGADAVWVAEIGAGQIACVRDGAEAVAVTEFPLPDRSCRPHAVVADQHGCWFTEWAANRIGHVMPDGTVEEFDLPASAAEPHGITVGPDGSIWVAAESGSVIRFALG